MLGIARNKDDYVQPFPRTFIRDYRFKYKMKLKSEPFHFECK